MGARTVTPDEARRFAAQWDIRYWRGQIKLLTDPVEREAAYRQIDRLTARLEDLSS